MREYDRLDRYNKVKQQLNEMGYQLLTTSDEYKGSRMSLHTICPNGHENKIKNWSNYKRGRTCRECFEISRVSKGEKEVSEFVEECFPTYDIIKNDRTTVFNHYTGCYLEFDIWIPELNKAIEYNGEYWHGIFTDNDGIKIQWCKDNGISLMVIWDTQWRGDNDKIRREILEFIDIPKEQPTIHINDNKWIDYYKNWSPTEPELTYRVSSPTGIITEIYNGKLLKWCKDNNAPYNSIIQVVNGYNKSTKDGWTVEFIKEEDKQRAIDTRNSMNKPTGYSLKSVTGHKLVDGSGNIHEFDNIQNFCIENGLNHSAIGWVLKGVRKSHKGYTKYNN